MAKMIKLSTIKPPALYIRSEQGADMAHVQMLRDVVSQCDKAYPFHDPIVVRRLSKSEKAKVSMGGKPGTVEYELVRGVHRCMALAAEKWTEASADIIEAGDAEAFAAQYDDAERGTIKSHDLKERNFYIRTLRDNFGWTLVQIGGRMKLTEASISRILAEKQASGKSKPRKKRGSKKKAAAAATAESFQVSEWFAVLGELVAAFESNRDAVLGFMDKSDPAIVAGAEKMIAILLGNEAA